MEGYFLVRWRSVPAADVIVEQEFRDVEQNEEPEQDLADRVLRNNIGR